MLVDLETERAVTTMALETAESGAGAGVAGGSGSKAAETAAKVAARGDGAGKGGDALPTPPPPPPAASATATNGDDGAKAEAETEARAGGEGGASERPRKADREVRRESHSELESRLLKEGVFDENFVSLKEDAGEEMLPEILDLYTSEGEDLTSKLVALSEADDLAGNLMEIQNLIHRFKGSSLNVGIAKMCACCIQVRQFCVDKDLTKTQSGLLQMRQEFTRIKDELEAYFESFPNKKRKAL